MFHVSKTWNWWSVMLHTCHQPYALSQNAQIGDSEKPLEIHLRVASTHRSIITRIMHARVFTSAESVAGLPFIGR